MGKFLVVIVICFAAWLSAPERSFAQNPEADLPPDQIDPSMLPPIDPSQMPALPLPMPGPIPGPVQQPVPHPGQQPAQLPTQQPIYPQQGPQPGLQNMTIPAHVPVPPPVPPPGAPPTVSSEMAPAPAPQTIAPPVDPEKEAEFPYAVVKTNLGSFTIRLHQLKAPRTVEHFIGLAKGEKEFTEMSTGRKIQRPYYDGLIFHKVIPDFVIQTGCPLGNGTGGPGYTVPDEFDPALLHDKAGVVSMSKPLKDKGEPIDNANGSQFFITLAPQPQFDHKYTVFGQVVEGMGVVRKISKVKRGPTDKPIRPVILESITIDYRKK